MSASHSALRAIFESSEMGDERGGGQPYILLFVSVCPVYTALAGEVPPQAGVDPPQVKYVTRGSFLLLAAPISRTCVGWCGCVLLGGAVWGGTNEQEVFLGSP